eukprot:EG_transcript_3981
MPRSGHLVLLGVLGVLGLLLAGTGPAPMALAAHGARAPPPAAADVPPAGARTPGRGPPGAVRRGPAIPAGARWHPRIFPDDFPGEPAPTVAVPPGLHHIAKQGLAVLLSTLLLSAGAALLGWSRRGPGGGFLSGWAIAPVTGVKGFDVSRDYYAELRVKGNASEVEIKAAYRQMAREYHPDINHDPGAPQKLLVANQAYRVLSNALDKRDYDLARAQKFPNASRNYRPASAAPRSPGYPPGYRPAANPSAAGGNAHYTWGPAPPPPQGSGWYTQGTTGQWSPYATRKEAGEAAAAKKKKNAAKKKRQQQKMRVVDSDEEDDYDVDWNEDEYAYVDDSDESDDLWAEAMDEVKKSAKRPRDDATDMSDGPNPVFDCRSDVLRVRLAQRIFDLLSDFSFVVEDDDEEDDDEDGDPLMGGWSNPAGPGEYVWAREIPGQRMSVRVHTTVADRFTPGSKSFSHWVSDRPEDLIRVSAVYYTRQQGRRVEVLQGEAVRRVGSLDQISRRLEASMKELWETAHRLPRCPHCRAPLLPRAGGPAGCAERCAPSVAPNPAAAPAASPIAAEYRYALAAALVQRLQDCGYREAAADPTAPPRPRTFWRGVDGTAVGVHVYTPVVGEHASVDADAAIRVFALYTTASGERVRLVAAPPVPCAGDVPIEAVVAQMQAAMLHTWNAAWEAATAGKCPRCHAPSIVSPTGKRVCSELCWARGRREELDAMQRGHPAGRSAPESRSAAYPH